LTADGEVEAIRRAHRDHAAGVKLRKHYAAWFATPEVVNNILNPPPFPDFRDRE